MIRRLYLDRAAGERRGVVTLDGQPERLFIERDGDSPRQQVGARLVARVRKVDRTLKSAFLDLGVEPDAVLSLTGPALSLAQGAWVEVEIISPARSGKGAVAALLRPGEGPIRLLQAPPPLDARLSIYSPGAAIADGAAARNAADIAEESALKIEHGLPSGGRLFIEQTQALTAIDVDIASAAGDSRKAMARANREAIVMAARLLRLKGLGGLVVIDLAGKGHDGAALSALAKAAFQPDGEGVSIGPISRFGLFEFALPRTATPVADRLLDGDGRPSAVTMGLRMLRAIERAAGPGQRVQAICAPEVAEVAKRLEAKLVDRIGPRFVIHPDETKDRTLMEIVAQ